MKMNPEKQYAQEVIWFLQQMQKKTEYGPERKLLHYAIDAVREKGGCDAE